jgi:hypothetical protein
VALEKRWPLSATILVQLSRHSTAVARGHSHYSRTPYSYRITRGSYGGGGHTGALGLVRLNYFQMTAVDTSSDSGVLVDVDLPNTAASADVFVNNPLLKYRF